MRDTIEDAPPMPLRVYKCTFEHDAPLYPLIGSNVFAENLDVQVMLHLYKESTSNRLLTRKFVNQLLDILS